jgi:hypothetical protein
LPGQVHAQGAAHEHAPSDTSPAYVTADAYADAAPARAEQSVSALAAYLARSGPDELTRARALYRWVTGHIAYDVAGLRAVNVGDASAEDVLRRRVSVCEGYARLTAALGSAMGLEIGIVEGWSKGYGYVPRQFDGPTNHAWNVVRIDGNWRLIDPTWGAGYIDQRMHFVRRFQPYYFLTSPESFVFDHLPLEARWQLLQRPVSRAAYTDMVRVQPMFFAAGFRIASHSREQIVTDDHVTITLGVTEPVQMMAQLVDAGTGRPVPGEFAFVQVDDAKAEVRAFFPSAGEYVLRLFAKPRDAAGALEWVLDYRVRASRGAGAAAFPLAYTGFGASGAWVLEPLGGILKPARTYRFRLRAPGAIDVAVLAGNVWTHLAHDGEEFSGTVPVAAGDNVVFAKYDAGSKFVGLLKYFAQ